MKLYWLLILGRFPRSLETLKWCQDAIESALASSCYDSAAIQHLLNAEDLRHTACEAINVGALERYARPLPVMNEYDQLLTIGGAR